MTPVPCPFPDAAECSAQCRPCPWCEAGERRPPRVYTVVTLPSGEARAQCAGCGGGGYAHEEVRA